MKYKYPRTFHLPWSLGISSDDKVANDLSIFENVIFVTKKMDGESFTGYNDSCHARSLDSKHHSSRDYVKSLHSTFKYLIPENYRVCGENLFAKHSISYDDLESYLLIFSNKFKNIFRKIFIKKFAFVANHISFIFFII